MATVKSSVVRKRNSQMSIRLDDKLYEEYKELLNKEGVSLTEDIESYIKSRLGKTSSTSKIVDITQLALDVEYLKEVVGKWKAS